MSLFYYSCKEVDPSVVGCTQVSGEQTLVKVQVDVDSDREIEKIHALLLNHMDKLEAMQGETVTLWLLLFSNVTCDILKELFVQVT